MPTLMATVTSAGPANAERLTSRGFLALLVCMAFAFPLGRTVTAITELSAMTLAGWWLLTRAWPDIVPDTSRRALSYASAALVLAAVISVSNPNIPDTSTAILGIRKTSLFLVALIVGALAPPPLRRKAGQYAYDILLVWLIACLVVHTLYPGLEASFARAADFYTGNFNGQMRLQGIAAGPFHVAMASCFVFLGALGVSRRRPYYGGLGLIVGTVALYETQVRTGFIAVGLGALSILWVGFKPGVARRRFAMALGVLGAGMTCVTIWLSEMGSIDLTALSSLLTLSSDTRATGRFATWRQGVDAFVASPIYGWGAGSSGDTLGNAFVHGVHVTSHNVLIKFAVELGIVGVILLGAVIYTASSGLSRDVFETSPFVLPALVSLGVFSLFEAAIEAQPVCFLLALVIGASVGRGASPADATQEEPVR